MCATSRAQRLSSYAPLVEVGTFGSLVALFLLSVEIICGYRSHQDHTLISNHIA
jgi:hypothetical protein